MTALDMRSLRNSGEAVALVRPEIPTSLNTPGSTATAGLSGVVEDHARRAAAGEIVHTYARHGGAVFVVVVVRDNARDQVLVSGPRGEELWRDVCAALTKATTAQR